MTDNVLADLKTTLRGELITRADEEAFTAARSRGWNRDLNAHANPLGFVIASGVRDIVTTVNYCQSNNIPITVRGKGAHSPYGMAGDAVVIDLMKMTAVRVDPEKKLVFVQAGADGGDVDHETALHNLICITGSVSHTGFAGVALGGGIGHLSRWLGAVVDSIVGYEMVSAVGEVIRVDAARDPELFWGMRGNGASFGIVTEFVLKLRDMPNNGVIRSAPILWGADKAKEVMTPWMDRIARPDRKETETLQFAFLHSPDGHPVCGVVPLIVGETEAAAKATCDELAAYGGEAMVRQDTQLPYTALQAALDDLFPFDTNYWDKGVFIDWDPSDSNAISSIVDTVVQHWDEKPDFASKMSTFILFMEVNGAVGKADPESTSFAARGGRLWCTAIISWSEDDDSKRAASKTWCDAFVQKLGPFHVTTYLNNAMPESDSEMLCVFPEATMNRLRALKAKHDPDNVFKTGAWQYEANR
ncbi:FAD-binding oxidoreductase [Gammaproteobacteria bacterium]|nr:FAD-binding oxidoreductase [Gammaproteobacteria bacterium]